MNHISALTMATENQEPKGKSSNLKASLSLKIQYYDNEIERLEEAIDIINSKVEMVD